MLSVAVTLLNVVVIPIASRASAISRASSPNRRAAGVRATAAARAG
jgi:hypothetical protein